MSIGTLGALRILATQSPTTPPRSVATRDRVRRRRHGHVPVTWIDEQKAARGVIVHLHGGSYLRGERTEHWTWLEEVARRADVAAAMIHYSLAPRHPFPRADEDVLHALHALDRAALLPAGRWVLSGDEAGAGLALGVQAQLGAIGVTEPSLLLLSAPWADLTADHRLDGEHRQAARMYADGADREDPRISPLRGDLEGLPPVHLAVGGDDVLAPDSRALVERIAAAGGEAVLHEEPGHGDGFPIVRPGVAAQRAWRAQIAAVRAAVGARPATADAH